MASYPTFLGQPQGSLTSITEASSAQPAVHTRPIEHPDTTKRLNLHLHALRAWPAAFRIAPLVLIFIATARSRQRCARIRVPLRAQSDLDQPLSEQILAEFVIALHVHEVAVRIGDMRPTLVFIAARDA